MKPTVVVNVVLGVLLVVLSRPFGRMIADFQRRFWRLDLGESAPTVSMLVSMLVGLGLIVMGLTR